MSIAGVAQMALAGDPDGHGRQAGTNAQVFDFTAKLTSM